MENKLRNLIRDWWFKGLCILLWTRAPCSVVLARLLSRRRSWVMTVNFIRVPRRWMSSIGYRRRALKQENRRSKVLSKSNKSWTRSTQHWKIDWLIWNLFRFHQSSLSLYHVWLAATQIHHVQPTSLSIRTQSSLNQRKILVISNLKAIAAPSIIFKMEVKKVITSFLTLRVSKQPIIGFPNLKPGN